MRRSLLRSRLGRVAATLLVVAPLVAVAVTAVQAPGVATAACTLCAGGEYHPIPPTRILDTRPPTTTSPTLPINDVQPYGAKPINATTTSTGLQRFDVQLLGYGNAEFENPWMAPWMAPSDVLAVAVRIVVVRPGTAGRLAVWPTGTPTLSARPVVNFPAGQITSNVAIVRPGTGGTLTMEMRGAAASTAHLWLEVVGWYSTSTYLGEDGVESQDERGDRTIPVAPGRILATAAGAVGPGESVEVTARGAMTIGSSPRLVVPDSPSVTGLIVNLTVSLPTVDTWVSVVPTLPAAGAPRTSNENVSAGTVRSALVIVPIAADGKIRLYNKAGDTRLVVDVLGYLEMRPDELRSGRVVPLTALFRSFDTRLAAFGKVPLGPGQREQWSFAAFAASVNVSAVSVGNQLGFLGNLTNASLARQYPTVPVRSDLRLTPSPGTVAVPVATHISTPEGLAVSNLTVVMYGTESKIWVYNASGYAHYLADVAAVILSD